jgi:hypothetical protein
LQAFSTTESARNIRFLLQVLEDYFFYDCPGFAVLAGDFGSGLSAGFAQKAAQDAKDRQKQLVQKGKQIVLENVPNDLQFDNHLLLTTSTTLKGEDKDQENQLASPTQQIPPKNIPNELEFDDYPLPTAATRPDYKVDS